MSKWRFTKTVVIPIVLFPDWRWLMNRMDTPWYPTIHLICQTQPSDWGSVFQKVR